MVVIHPKLDICWSYVAIYMYMTNILIVVIMFNKIYSPPRKKRNTTRKISSRPVNKTKSNALLNNPPIDVFCQGLHIVSSENIPRLLFYQRELHEDSTMLSFMKYTDN